jgi:cyanophycin synthetase
MARANPGDLVVLCVDKHPAVLAELESISHHAQAGAMASGDFAGDPDFTAISRPPQT